MDNDDRVRAGQAAYTPLTLKIYDWFVLGFSNRFVWRCPTSELEALYDRNVSARHLDVGVGTGYFLDKAAWPVADPQITLVDLNSHSLDAAARRIGRFSPEAVVANILEPLPIERTFDSVGLCYLLHCLPGSIPEKAVLFDHVLPVMADGASLFGATIVQGDAPRSRAAQALMNIYNRKGIFSNAQDRFE
ncbi:MAG: class I SAM-dependent methyltransferase, partial [Hyphomicrobiales bacterium]